METKTRRSRAKLRTTLEVCELTGVTYRQLTYWVQKGYVTAQPHKPPGVKLAYLFDAAAVRQVRRLKAASEKRREHFGFSPLASPVSEPPAGGGE